MRQRRLHVTIKTRLQFAYKTPQKAPANMARTEASSATQALYIEVETHRPYLLKYALAKLRDDTQAEEVVQEALLAALTSIDSFQGGSTLRTWLTSILKFKIVDWQRSITTERARSVSMTPADDDSDEMDPHWLDPLFDESGHWRQQFADWGQPEAAFEQKAFFDVFEHCLAKLPENTARAFFLREIAGEDSADVCRELCVSTSNLWVMLHRARNGLRDCIERNWFQSTKATAK
jgi:RNA polymerase sigma-70 factor, ECF subfamily